MLGMSTDPYGMALNHGEFIPYPERPPEKTKEEYLRESEIRRKIEQLRDDALLSEELSEVWE